MTATSRNIGFIGFSLTMALYFFAPQLFGLDEEGLMVRDVLAQCGGPLVAGLCCLAAAWRSPYDRLAWTLFGTASLLYFGGNLFYLLAALRGTDLTFPSPAEWTFLAMAPIFACGAFIYGRVWKRLSRTSLLNFLLVYCAITVGSVLALGTLAERTELDTVGVVMAIGYPAIWVSVAAALVLTLLQYNLGGRTFIYVLICCAAVAEATADALYAGSILDGTYLRGGATQLLWVASVGFVIWAAFVQMSYARQPRRWFVAPKAFRRSMQAAIPAMAIFVALSAEIFAHGFSDTIFMVALIAVAILSLLAGLREHWIGKEQRQLQASVETSRNALERSQAQLVAVLESTTDSIVVVEPDWRVSYLNRQAEELLSFLPDFRVGRRLWDVVPDMNSLPSSRLYLDVMKTREPAEFEEFYADMWFDVHIYPTAGGGLSVFFRDISEARRAREEIRHLAHHDALTGLANRTLFRQRLLEAANSGKPSATLVLDLDHFKEVNDSLGHPIGDRVLAATAQRLRDILSPEDTIARLGGDEFAIILRDEPSRTDVEAVARQIQIMAAAPHDIDGQHIKVGVSVGVALSEGNGDDPDRLFKGADIALYAAKSDSRGAVRFFDPAMESELLERQALRSRLQGAAERGELELHYQPIVNLRRQGVASFEALVRWRHPIHGLVPPAVFIPIAEESGLIVQIGEWVLRTACAEAATWPEDISVAVNLSPRQFRQGEILTAVRDALEFSGLAGNRLELEITESVMLDDTNASTATLHRLRGLGVRIALDDFGTGYSSLAYLQQFPFSKIKIDRSFIQDLPDNEESQAIVKMVIGLGKALGLRVTAEGVETEDQLNWIRRGCDEAQGYLLSKPVPAGEVHGLIDRLSAPVRRERMRA